MLLNKDSDFQGLFSIEELKHIILNFLKTFCDSELTKQVDGNAFRLYYNNQESINQDDRKILLSEEANKLFRTLIEKYPESYIKLLIRPLKTPHDGITFTLEPFIPQTFGSYAEFENFLKPLRNIKEVLEVKTFYHKFKNENHQPIEFVRNKIEFFSDEQSIFIRSDKFPSIPIDTSAVSFNHPYQTEIIKKYPDFKFAKWIAHTYPIDTDQATAGGDYQIQFQFDFNVDETEIENAQIKLFVDDYCRLVVNGKTINSRFETPNGKIFDSEIIVKYGLNTILFTIENNSAETNAATPPLRPVTGIENPYGIVFIVQIQLKK